MQHDQRLKGTGWALLLVAGGVDACLNEASTAKGHAMQLIPAQYFKTIYK